MAPRVAHKTCNLCEAMCGLRITVDGDAVGRIEGDPDDPISRGHLCPKAIALREIQDDPDRLRRPLRRRGRDWEEISFDDALAETAERLHATRSQHGADAVGVYLGNPGAHSLGVILGLSPLHAVLATRNRYAASSLDQNPKHAASVLLFGNFLRIAVPDIDRTDFLLVLGANPVVSGGSLMSAPGVGKRLRALRERGGRLVVVDPRRTETAELADDHLPLRPGLDGLLLAALVHTVLDEKHTVLDEERAAPGPLASRLAGTPSLAEALAPFSPEAVAPRLGLDAARIRGLARDFSAAPSAVCYGRVGTCQHPYGTLATWLVDVLNLLTGNFDRPGGAMFPTPAADLADLARLRGAPGHLSQWTTRVRGAPCFNGEAPTPCLGEEIRTPGPGQIRALLTIAGNPVLSAPNGAALGEALATLPFMASLDFYVNETTRHAHVILPPSWSLEHDNYEILFHGFAVRNTARFSPALVAPRDGQPDDYELLTDLTLRLAGREAGTVRRAAIEAIRRSGLVPSPRRLLDWMLRIGPHGDGFRPWRSGLRVRDLEANPSGIDLGPLRPCLDEVLPSPEWRIDLAPEVMLAELDRLAREGVPGPRPDAPYQLIGRRDVRTNNSWLHNTRMATKGRERCTLIMHPDDARREGLATGDRALIRSRVGQVEAPVVVSDEVLPGVVSLPHGWGHRGEGLRMGVAQRHPGVSVNDLVDDAALEPVVGNAILNGVPVEVVAAPGADSPGAAGADSSSLL